MTNSTPDCLRRLHATVPDVAKELIRGDILIGVARKTLGQPEEDGPAKAARPTCPAHREGRAIDQGTLRWWVAVPRVLRPFPPDGRVTVQFRLDDSANLVGADRGGHERFGELLGQIRESLGVLRVHGSLHLSAADGGTTMPELARCVQVRHDVRGSAPSGLRSGPHVRGSGHRIAVDSSPLAGGARLSQLATGNRVAAVFAKTRGAPNQGHSRTPAKGPRCSTWPTLPFGSAASVLPSCCTGQGPELAVFRETARRSRVFQFFMRRINAARCPTPFAGPSYPAPSRVSCPRWCAKRSPWARRLEVIPWKRRYPSHSRRPARFAQRDGKRPFLQTPLAVDSGPFELPSRGNRGA